MQNIIITVVLIALALILVMIFWDNIVELLQYWWDVITGITAPSRGF